MQRYLIPESQPNPSPDKWQIPWTGNQAYGKNLRIQMGRCPVRSIFPEALEMLKKKQHLLGYVVDPILAQNHLT